MNSFGISKETLKYISLVCFVVISVIYLINLIDGFAVTTFLFLLAFLAIGIGTVLKEKTVALVGIIVGLLTYFYLGIRAFIALLDYDFFWIIFVLDILEIVFFASFLASLLDKKNRQVLAYVCVGLLLVTFVFMWIECEFFPGVITLLEIILTMVGTYCAISVFDEEIVKTGTHKYWGSKPMNYTSSDAVRDLAKLQDLVVRGIITQNDFLAKKKELLRRTGKTDQTENISRLKGLAEKGIITKEEYLAKRKEILGE